MSRSDSESDVAVPLPADDRNMGSSRAFARMLPTATWQSTFTWTPGMSCLNVTGATQICFLENSTATQILAMHRARAAERAFRSRLLLRLHLLAPFLVAAGCLIYKYGGLSLALAFR